MKINKILITGGTGSLGKALTKEIFIRYPNIGSVIVFSRDEQKHFQMREEFPVEKFALAIERILSKGFLKQCIIFEFEI